MRGRDLPEQYRRTLPGRTRWLAFPLDPEALRRFGAEAVAARTAPRMVRYMAEVGARPARDDAGRITAPQVYSEAEMRRLDAGAVLWRPGRSWLVVELEDHDGVKPDHGEGPVHYVDPTPEG